MEWVADLHIHSRFSRATSHDLDLPHLYLAAQRKGVALVGTGDFTHPAWFAELERQLVLEEEGLYALRPEVAQPLDDQLPSSCAAPVRFMLTAEISNIYKRDERTRKVHNLVCMPDLQSAAALNRALARIGNIASDGRPILGLDSRDLLELVLDASPRGVLIPAHIWTPWFSVLGSKSGFDSLDACYRDLAPQVFAVETGLSSDPPMNWRLSSLDRYALVSNSDAHSPGKLAREATLFSCPLSYDDLFAALRRRAPGHVGTLEFFPEEGKYHFDGHRRCGVRLSPAQTREADGRCPVCGRPLTLGVLYRVAEIADRPDGARPAGAAPFRSLVALHEVLGEVLGVGAETRSVTQAADALLQRLGCELRILRDVPLEELRSAGGVLLVEALRRMRAGEVHIDGGYDGEFGHVHLLDPEERCALAGQTSLFGAMPAPRRSRRTSEMFTVAAVSGAGPVRVPEPRSLPLLDEQPLSRLNDEQRQAAAHRGSPVVIVAGPGTGKTRTLTCRIAQRVREGQDPAMILAVTFTTKAAAEMRERLRDLLGPRGAPIRVSTFHALALAVLSGWRQRVGLPALLIVGEAERLELLAQLLPDASERQLAQAARQLSLSQLGSGPSSPLLEPYRAALAERGAEDLDGLVGAALSLLEREPQLLGEWRRGCAVICVDEYQDVNQAQAELVRLLSSGGADLCVIGDPDQAIYSFRGADPSHFSRFSEDFPDAARFSLQQSHRSGRAILEAASAVIQHNEGRLDTRIWSEEPGAPHVRVHRAATPAAEAEFIVHGIERAMGGTTLFSLDSGRSDGLADAELSFSDFAVLFRTAAQAEALREAFERSGMPYVCTAGASSLDSIAPVLDLLHAVVTATLPEEDADPELVAQVRRRPARRGLAVLVEALCPAETQHVALQQVERLAAQLYTVEADLSRWAPLVLGLAAAASETDAVSRREAVALLTLHASKGLEFSTVFIAGCEEGLLPLLHASSVPEERRLLYVGMTRARRSLTLTCAARRVVNGAPRAQEPSRFLREIPAALLEHVQMTARRRRHAQLDLF
jgi:DNA helicase-2/ATP-dependent DNA helicase PcrA